MSFVKVGLRDLSVSRTSFTWGIPVPGDRTHVMYVWLDALTNYITAVGYPDTKSENFRRIWPANLHMVGKDILRFHAVYWPAFLMAAGLAPPQAASSPMAGGPSRARKCRSRSATSSRRRSWSTNTALDAVRYFMLRELPFGNDGDFSHRAMIGRINGDLANGLGNLAQRVLSMINRNCAAAVPEPGA